MTVCTAVRKSNTLKSIISAAVNTAPLAKKNEKQIVNAKVSTALHNWNEPTIFNASAYLGQRARKTEYDGSHRV